jgi:hypothetical protein
MSNSNCVNVVCTKLKFRFDRVSCVCNVYGTSMHGSREDRLHRAWNNVQTEKFHKF